eukprot:GHVQ01036599.1.p1 GENE.GHVQ01036599.1~~GHVQ01036599.1.p1  ORF type:complete len:768 (-),score=120.22 GHVQ01036599.1:1187-3490(-)
MSQSPQIPTISFGSRTPNHSPSPRPASACSPRAPPVPSFSLHGQHLLSTNTPPAPSTLLRTSSCRPASPLPPTSPKDRTSSDVSKGTDPTTVHRFVESLVAPPAFPIHNIGQSVQHQPHEGGFTPVPFTQDYQLAPVGDPLSSSSDTTNSRRAPSPAPSGSFLEQPRPSPLSPPHLAGTSRPSAHRGSKIFNSLFTWVFNSDNKDSTTQQTAVSMARDAQSPPGRRPSLGRRASPLGSSSNHLAQRDVTPPSRATRRSVVGDTFGRWFPGIDTTEDEEIESVVIEGAEQCRDRGVNARQRRRADESSHVAARAARGSATRTISVGSLSSTSISSVDYETPSPNVIHDEESRESEVGVISGSGVGIDNVTVTDDLEKSTGNELFDLSSWGKARQGVKHALLVKQEDNDSWGNEHVAVREDVEGQRESLWRSEQFENWRNAAHDSKDDREVDPNDEVDKTKHTNSEATRSSLSKWFTLLPDVLHPPVLKFKESRDSMASTPRLFRREDSSDSHLSDRQGTGDMDMTLRSRTTWRTPRKTGDGLEQEDGPLHQFSKQPDAVARVDDAIRRLRESDISSVAALTNEHLQLAPIDMPFGEEEVFATGNEAANDELDTFWSGKEKVSLFAGHKMWEMGKASKDTDGDTCNTKRRGDDWKFVISSCLRGWLLIPAGLSWCLAVVVSVTALLLVVLLFTDDTSNMPNPMTRPSIQDVCNISPWSSWSSCAAMCGAGMETRTRQVAGVVEASSNQLDDCIQDYRPCSGQCGETSNT